MDRIPYLEGWKSPLSLFSLFENVVLCLKGVMPTIDIAST
jgi:hypothetical protein